MNLWNFMASPTAAANAGRDAKRRPRTRREANIKVPWFISAAVLADVVRVLLGTLVLLGLAYDYGDAMPGWFFALIGLHCAAMIVTLVFILNGFPLARLCLIVLAIGQLWFDQTMITRWFLLADALLIVVFFIRPSARYFSACDNLRTGRN